MWTCGIAIATQQEIEASDRIAVELEIEATYKKGRHSVDGYVEQTSMANPHAKITYVAPGGERHEYERVAQELPKPPLEIKPHPHGVELGILLKMLHETKARNIGSFLHSDFSRVSGPVAEEIAKTAGVSPPSTFIWIPCAPGSKSGSVSSWRSHTANSWPSPVSAIRYSI